MTVKFYPGIKGEKSSLIARFLVNHAVQHELIQESDVPSYRNHLYKSGEAPALEVDGRLFVDPNDEALRKILRLD